jgi:hypothetical protein
MRSLVYSIACTVDGCIAQAGGSTAFFGFEGAVGPRALEVTGHRTYPNGSSLLRGRLGSP